MAEPRRFPGFVAFLGFLLLVVPLGVSAWWFARPAPEPAAPGPPIDELDVVCTGRVDVEGSVVNMDLSTPGRIARVQVSEGADVKRGQEMLAIDDAAYRLAVREAKAMETATGVEVAFAEQRLRQWPRQLEVKAKQVAALRAEVSAADERLKQLRTQQALTSAVAGTDVAVAEATVGKLRNYADAEQIALDEMKKADAELELRAAKAKLATATVAVERAEQGVRDCVLVAPSDGTVLRLNAVVGGMLAPGIPGGSAVVFVPAGPRVVRAEVEQANLGRVKIGMTATVKDDARTDSPVWTGRVKRIAGWVAQRRSILFEPGELNDLRTTEVLIELVGEGEPLWIGQRMQVRLKR